MKIKLSQLRKLVREAVQEFRPDHRRLTDAEYSKIGEPGECEDCGAPGEWTLDPISAEDFGDGLGSEDRLVCLCDMCAGMRAEDI